MNRIVFFFMCLPAFAFGQTFTFDFNTSGQRVCLVESTVDLAAPSVTIHLLDAVDNTTDATSIYRRPINGTGADWTLVANNLPAGTSTWTDNSVSIGEVWEYQIRRANTWTYAGATYDAIGYTIGAVDYDQSGYRGRMILLVADDVPLNLPNKYLRLKQELTADGWFVEEIVTPRATSWDSGNEVVSIRSQIQAMYAAAPSSDKPKQLFILGHVPLPRSGSSPIVAPDDHDENKGARGCDAYYADIDGAYTDTATFNPGGLATPLAINLPGDFKWDQDQFPSDIEMAFGRVDFAGLTENTNSELQIISDYLDRLSKYKNVESGWYMGNRAAFFYGYDNSNDGSFRALPNLVSSDSLVENYAGPNHNQWVADNGPFMVYMQNLLVPTANDWFNIGMNATVFSSDQSYWGFGDVPQGGGTYSRIRSILSYDTKCLVALWTTTGINMFHQACMGETVGGSFKQIMNHNSANNYLEKPPQSFDESDWWNRTHFAYYGDPTLRLHQVYPASNLLITDSGTGAALSWGASPDPRVIGYHVYKSSDELGQYTQLTASPQGATSYSDLSYQQGDWYMVRAIIQQPTGCGSFLNPSIGIMSQGTFPVSIDFLPEIELSIHPNPSQEVAYIQSDIPMSQIQVYSSQGRLVAEHIISDQTQHVLNVSEYANGVYLIRIQIGEYSFTRHLFIEN